MPRLYFTEQGRVVVSGNEEITRWRWARKQLTLPAPVVGARSELFLLLARYAGNRTPLEVYVNSKRCGSLLPHRQREVVWGWYRVPLPRGKLRAGKNQIVLMANATAMNAWTLAISSTVSPPRSHLSLDQGNSWQNKRMGIYGAACGEYVIRVRSYATSLREHTLPRIVYEDPACGRVRALRKLLPDRIRRQRDPWKQLLLLRSWVARRWKYSRAGGAYAPWDAATIIDWARRGSGNAQDGVIAMCVHFAVVFASFATSLGHIARCYAVSPDLNSSEGHFLAEVYDESHRRWILHDANFDVHYEQAGQPLSLINLADRAIAGSSCFRLVRRGSGFPTESHLVDCFAKLFATGKSYKLAGLWARNDYLSNPTVAPPNHGRVAYCETDFLWYAPPALDGMLTGMFPYRAATRTPFECPPKK